MKILTSYRVESEGVPAEIAILEKDGEYVGVYELMHTKIKAATSVALSYLKEKIIDGTNLKISEILDPRESERVKGRIIGKAHEIIRNELSGISGDEENILVGRLAQEMLGLGEIELLLADEQLEEVVINSAAEPVWVYHRKFGWLKTNIRIPSEEQVHNFASIIGRRVGRQITSLEPLMDAHLPGGNRVNATLYPISTKGNGITIRKFAKDPWTIVSMIANGTLNRDAAALFWLALQYEMSMLVGGGTASGKTSFLNAVLVFTPPNQRLISIEDTREIQLPDFLHWTPMVTRQPNPEGKGGIEMLDLVVNSLRMRPDRIVVGEIRRQREAEVLFEAMHTGHSVYSTIHADDAAQVRNRLITPPIGLPENQLEALQLVVVQYRQRRIGVRRTFEIAEVVPTKDGVSMNLVYKWDPRSDVLVMTGQYARLAEELIRHTGLTVKEIQDDLREKEMIIDSLLKSKLTKVDEVGKVVAWYYRNSGEVATAARENKLIELLS
ncbi:CpaF family protein [Candidatus Micrarchaeota archaeon]|nr:CpaF family protein [Candidatus Micrarchaeota archaeon]